MHYPSVTSSTWLRFLKHIYQSPQSATHQPFVLVFANILLYWWSALLLLTIGVWGVKIIQPAVLGDMWNTVFVISALTSFLLIPATHALRTEQRYYLLGLSMLTAAVTLWIHDPCPSCTQSLAFVTPATLPTLSNDDLRAYHFLLQGAQQYQTFCTFFAIVGLILVSIGFYRTWQIMRLPVVHQE